ncbi:MAG: precorrin-2 C(20)-methyltransferase [Nitrospiraceae bacterium]|nr:precorrin-2 C(20)-methyltransferase [Nitrospiraceae bacterium]
MKVKLFAVGVGPGDPELLTLKAVRILKEVGAVAVPKGRAEGMSLALGIVGRAVDLTGKKILEIHFPMVKDIGPEALKPAAAQILEILRRGESVAFVTLGDPTLYSTFFRLREALALLDPSVPAEIVPGVTSVTAAAARAGLQLALSGQKLAIVPVLYRNELPYQNDLSDILENFETVCLMKAGSALPEIKKMLEEMGLIDNAVCVCRTGMPGEFVKPVAEVTDDELDYFTTIIVSGIKADSGKGGKRGRGGLR